MKKILATLTALFTLTTPALSGERIENLEYEAPEGPIVLSFACAGESELHHFLDHIEDYRRLYNSQRIAPNRCAVFQPQPMPMGVDTLEYLYLADGKLYGIVSINLEDATLWTFVNVDVLNKIGPGDT